MQKPLILLETDLFTEDELQDTREVISKYFQVEPVSLAIALYHREGLQRCVKRCSLQVAAQLGHKFEYADVLNWMPVFRRHTVSPSSTFFVELEYIKDYKDSSSFKSTFIRPVSPFKTFSGQVFASRDKFVEEYNFMVRNKNVDPKLLCMVSDAKQIDQEYRCIFINNEHVSSSKYMDKGQPSIEPSVPERVIDFAKMLSKNTYFQNVFNFVIDVGVCNDTLYMIEVNAFETASFYAADLDLVYKTLATAT